MLVITAVTTLKENPVMATPKAVDAAGGCSVSVTTIVKVERPTASEYANAECRNDCCGIKAQSDPKVRPIRCPPITFLGRAVMLFGIAKTMKAVAPMAAITTEFSIVITKSTKNTVTAARKLCERKFFQSFLFSTIGYDPS